MSNAQKVIRYLEAHKFISSMRIIDMLNATSPSKVTSEVRRILSLDGRHLADMWRTNENTGKRYKVYWIAEG